jgi:hypothetical protein
MRDNKKTPKPVEKTARTRVTRGKTTEELRRKHLKDKKHKITDEEIRSIRIDTHVDRGDAVELPEGTERPKDADKDNRMTTPWDVISE